MTINLIVQKYKVLRINFIEDYLEINPTRDNLRVTQWTSFSHANI